MTEPPAPIPDREPLSKLVETLARQAETSARLIELIESKALPLLERIAQALERAPLAPALTASRPSGLAEFHAAIHARLWLDAEAIARELLAKSPGDPEFSRLEDELGRAKSLAAEDLRIRLDAARQTNDPDGVMALRDDLVGLIEPDALRELDRTLVKWLLTVIQKRLRTGTVGPDVAGLAARVAERFGGTVEGASLKAALPTLRRSAGLCARCGEPYAGLADACPKCLVPPAPTPGETSPGFDEELDDLEAPGEPVDLNNDRFWQIPDIP
jgi:hypothetical protein